MTRSFLREDVMPTWVEISEFLVVMWRILMFVLSGGAIMGIIHVVQRSRGNTVGWKAYTIVIGLSLLLGAFTEWRHAYTANVQLAEDNTRLQTDNNALSHEISVLTENKEELEQLVQELSMQSDNDTKVTPVATLCVHEPLRFMQKRIKSAQKNRYARYEKHLEVWIPESERDTGTIRIFTDGQFSGFQAAPRDVLRETEFGHHKLGGFMGEYQVRFPASSQSSLTMTLYGEMPFRIQCIDKVPSQSKRT